MSQHSNTITGTVVRSGRVLTYFNAKGELEKVTTFPNFTSALQEQRRVSWKVKPHQKVRKHKTLSVC